MPSPHPRVGLVVDEAMDRTLTRLAERRSGDPARAGVVRWAIYEGMIFEELLEHLGQNEIDGVATIILDALDELALPEDVVDGVRAKLEHASLAQRRALRRRRQLALLDEDVPPGPTAQDVIDSIESADDPFA